MLRVFESIESALVCIGILRVWGVNGGSMLRLFGLPFPFPFLPLDFAFVF